MKTLAEIISNPATRREQVASSMCFITDAREYIPYFDLAETDLFMYILSTTFLAFKSDIQGYHAKVLRKHLSEKQQLSIDEDALPYTHEELYEN